ncbi:hypothetical protein JXA85_08030 [Candidatus Woesearchaeota archaeon]|nr:hypothetical protein [Candidatus Woesearchaeota archaeon]
MVRINRNPQILVIFLLILVLLISGCGKKVCKTNADCSDDNKCTNDYCVKGKECKHTAIKDCHCGNGVCEKIENQCTCPEDCTKCLGKEGKYLKKVCVDDECVTDAANVTEKSFTDIITERDLKLQATYTYDYPFNLQKSVFNIKIRIQQLGTYALRPRINKVEVFKKRDRLGTDVTIFGSKRINKVLWSEDTEINEDIVLDNVEMNGSETSHIANVKIYYDYITGTKQEETPITYSKEFKEPIVFVAPTTKQKCPENCDDSNDCTKDYCSQKTGYFCMHDAVTSSCCGNNVCDPDEDKCTCPEDCGSCSGRFGSYMEFVCLEQECHAILRNDVVVTPRPIIDNRDISTDFSIEARIEYNEPFDVTQDNFKITIAMTKLNPATSDIVFERAHVLDTNNVLLGEKQDINSPLSQIGESFDVEIPVSFVMRDVEEEHMPKIKLIYSYTRPPRGTSPGELLTNQFYEKAIGKLVFVNPT